MKPDKATGDIMKFLKNISVYVVCVSLILSGCVTNTGSSGFNVGPQLSSIFGQKQDFSNEPDRPKIDVIIPIFDPGLPEDTSKYEKEGIWPELRRAEANRFAVKLKDALDATGAFGAVRVTPDKTATGDLYILGRIAESNGQDVEIDLEVFDISGEQWISKSFDHEVESEFHDNIRNEGKDAYEPLFAEAAQYIVEELNDHKTQDLENVQRLTELRFGASFSENAFAEHMEVDGGEVKLISMPSDNDPMLKRTRAIRVRDQLFVDRMQTHYQTFGRKMDDSYLMWQEFSLLEIQAEREAKIKAAGQAVAGIALIGLAILAAAAGAKSDNYNTQTAGVTGAVVAGVAGASLIGSSFQTSEEAKVHRDALAELGQSIDVELAPQVVEFEEKTVELTGDSKEQFAQWRGFLKQVYALESTPNMQL